MKKTTEDCKNFLAQWFKNHPDFPRGFQAYDDEHQGIEEEQQKAAWLLACNPKKWKRVEKHLHGSYYFCDNFGGQYSVQRVVLGQAISLNMPADNFTVERKFVCAEDRLEGRIAFLVLEDKQGNLYMGNDVGD